MHSKVTLFWFYYEENLVPVKTRTNNQNYNQQLLNKVKIAITKLEHCWKSFELKLITLPKNADHIFKWLSICINSATKRNLNFNLLTYINQTSHQKKSCIILMLALAFNFLLDYTEFCSKVGLKVQLWEGTNVNLSFYT